MKVTSHCQTDPGRIRELNEDCARIIQPNGSEALRRRGELFVVADGMGGHESGEVASSQAVETIADAYYRSPGDPGNALKQAIQEANAVIFRRSRDENRQGMGTTVVAAAHVGDTLYVAHVGDSRLYLIRDGEIRPLTNDHSLVAEQVAAGILTPEEATRHPHRNVISRAVGTAPQVEVELSSASPLILEEGDIVVLCSDGLTEHVKADRILELALHRPPAEAAKVLVEAANADGGTDNISVIIGRVGELPPEAAPTARLSAVSPPEEATAPQPVVPTPRGSARRVMLTLLALVALAGAGFVGWSFLSGGWPWQTGAPGGSLATATPSPSPPPRTPTPPRRPTRSPTPTLNRVTPLASTVLPSATVVAPGSPAPVIAPPSGDPNSRTITLVAPEDGQSTSGAVTFRAEIPNVGAADFVQLRLGQSPDSLLPIPRSLTPVGPTWEVTLTEPPNSSYGTWYWTIAVVSADASGSPVSFAAPPRRLEWASPTAQGDSSP